MSYCLSDAARSRAMRDEKDTGARVTGRKRSVLWRRARLVAVLLLAWSLLAWVAARALIVESEIRHADALVVLAGSSTYIERTHRAAQLFQEGRAPKVVLTNDNLQGGWSVEEQRNPFFAELAAVELKSRSVPADKIEIIPQAVNSTYEEAVRLREYALGKGLRSLLVVTSGYQSRRALWTLRRVFEGSGVVIGLDAIPPGEQTPRPATWWWHALGWRMVPGEYLKFAYYWVHY
jgi:uncharacterized SAM-binding protein YcdF (DUF218 family)